MQVGIQLPAEVTADVKKHCLKENGGAEVFLLLTEALDSDGDNK